MVCLIHEFQVLANKMGFVGILDYCNYGFVLNGEYGIGRNAGD